MNGWLWHASFATVLICAAANHASAQVSGANDTAIVSEVASNTAAATLRVSERSLERLFPVRASVYSFWHAHATTVNRYKVNGTLSLQGVPISTFNENTVVEFQVGGAQFAGQLGHDAGYTPGDTHARLIVTNVVRSTNWHLYASRDLSVQLHWNSDRAQFRMVGQGLVYRNYTYEPLDEPWVVAEELLGLPSEDRAVSIPAHLKLGDATATWEIPGLAEIVTSTNLFPWYTNEIPFVDSPPIPLPKRSAIRLKAARSNSPE